jgi:hypothetical protein
MELKLDSFQSESTGVVLSLCFLSACFGFQLIVNMCALLFTIELKLASFQSEYWNCSFFSILSAGLCALVFIIISYGDLRVVIGPSHRCWYCAFTIA